MLKKICRCGKLIEYHIKLCDECSSKAEEKRKQSNNYYKSRVKERDGKYNKFYNSSEWEKVRQVAIVRDHALCQDCLKKEEIEPYSTVHHIIPVKDNWYKRLDINNLICLCESCHQKRHNSMKGRGYQKSFS